MTDKNYTYKLTQRRNGNKFKESLAKRIQDCEDGILSRKNLYQYYIPELNSWRNAKARPYAEIDSSIRSDFNFLSRVVTVIGPRKSPNYSLDRIDNEQYVYHPDYLRWATSAEQANNRTSTRVIEACDPITGEISMHTLPEWAGRTEQKRMGITLDIIHKRFSDNWTPQEVLFIPKNGRRKAYKFCFDKPQVQNNRKLASRFYCAFERARLAHFPHCPSNITLEEKVILKPVAHFWQLQGGEPSKLIGLLFMHSSKIHHRLKDTSNLWMPIIPSPKFIRKYQSELFEAIGSVEESIQKSEKQKQMPQTLCTTPFRFGSMSKKEFDAMLLEDV